MGSKVERVLFISILAVSVLVFYLTTKKYTETKMVSNEKSIELNNFIEYDINSSSLLSTLLSDQAYQINNIWFLTKPVVTTDTIEYLKSKRALSKNGVIEFIDNVRVLQRDGKKYASDKSFYSIHTKKIITPGKFVLSNLSHKMQGVEMEYDIKTKVTRAKNVKGFFKIKNGK